MQEQLYNSDYLNQTASLLKTIKELSYAPFLGLTSGSIIDVGCGTGQDIFNIANLVNDQVNCVGLDADPGMIATALSQNAVKGNLSFQEGSADALPFADESFDGLRNERLIQHLSNPDKAFKDFNRVLKIAAPIAIVETDWSSISLYNAPIDIATRIKHFYAHENVASGNVALHLSTLLSQNGFGNIKFKVFPIVTDSLDQVKAFTRLEFVLQKMLELGKLSQNELTVLMSTLDKAATEGYFATALNMVVATAEKIK